MTDGKPFRYISKKYKISRPALFKRMEKIPDFKKDHMKKYKNMWIVDESGIKLITKPKQNSTAKVKSKKIGHYREKQVTKNDLISAWKQLSKIDLSQQKTIKQQQSTIHELSKRINDDNKKLVQMRKRKPAGLLSRIFHKL